MIVKIRYSKKAKKFLNRNSALLTESEVENLAVSAVKKIYRIEDTNINLKALKGKLKGYYRIRTGDIRIIFKLEEDKETKEKLIVIFFVKDIDFRGSIYD